VFSSVFGSNLAERRVRVSNTIKGVHVRVVCAGRIRREWNRSRSTCNAALRDAVVDHAEDDIVEFLHHLARCELAQPTAYMKDFKECNLNIKNGPGKRRAASRRF
jgi:hypothetical protein